MSKKYRLSNRQRKEYLIRGARLHVALPLPREEVSDLRQWAARSLPDVNPADIVQVDELEITVSTERSGAGLQSELGKIVGGRDPLPGCLTLQVAVAIVTLQSTPKPRRELPYQWPGELIPD